MNDDSLYPLLKDMERKTEQNGKRLEIQGVRYLFAVAGFLGFAVNYAVRVNLSVAIVAMVNSSAVYHGHTNSSHTTECKAESLNSSHWIQKEEPHKEGTFLWSPQEQGIILGAFYYGYGWLQIPGGRMADMYSGKWVFGFGSLISILLSLLTPIVAHHFHISGLIALRALQGLSQGVIFPSIYTMLSHWAPKSELGFLLGLICSGISVGTLAGMTVAGFLCNSDFLGGWPSAFYVTGAAGCVWFFLWCVLVTNTPHTHPLISDKELQYITSRQNNDKNKALPSFPWLKVMKSVPFWIVIICFLGGDWGFYVMLSELPTFFSTILQFDIEKNGFLSSFPYFLKTFVFIVAGAISDFMIRKNMTVGFVRKFSTFMSHIIASLFLVAVCFAGCNVTLYVTFLMAFIIFYGFNVSGFGSAILELCPEYSGTLMGMGNSLSSVIGGSFAPFMVGTLTEETQSLKQWHIVFGISAVIQAGTGLIFILFSSSKKQKWLKENDEEEKQ